MTLPRGPNRVVASTIALLLAAPVASVVDAPPVGAQSSAADSWATDRFEETVHLVAGGTPARGSDLDWIWASIMEGSAVEAMHRYEAPAAVVGYAPGTVPDTPCAIATNVRSWRANARYCPQDATIWYDEHWLRELAGRFGAFAPAAVLSHEWGHHVQTFTGGVGHGIRAELQADCFAGMYLGETEGAAPDGSSYTIREDELRTSMYAFFSLGDRDYRESQWFQPGVHGSPEQRVMAFTTGYIAKSMGEPGLRGLVNGLDWCLGYGDFEPGVYSDIGPYRLLGPPGRPGRWIGGALVIPPRAAPAFPASGIRLRWCPATRAWDAATEERLAQSLRTWLPGASDTPLGQLAVRTGTGVASIYTWHHGTAQEGGIAALVVPESGAGGLLILVSRPGSPDGTEELATFLEQASSVSQIVARLCAPGESTDPTDPSYDFVCATELQ